MAIQRYRLSGHVADMLEYHLPRIDQSRLWKEGTPDLGSGGEGSIPNRSKGTDRTHRLELARDQATDATNYPQAI